MKVWSSSLGGDGDQKQEEGIETRIFSSVPRLLLKMQIYANAVVALGDDLLTTGISCLLMHDFFQR